MVVNLPEENKLVFKLTCLTEVEQFPLELICEGLSFFSGQPKDKKQQQHRK